MGRGLIALAILLVACGGARPIPSGESETTPADATPARSRTARATRVRVRVLRVLAGSTRTIEAARQRASALARTARADDFSELAMQYGDGDDARRAELGAGGLEITGDAPATVPATVRAAALALEVREVSAPIEADDGLWILQRVE